LTYIVDGRWDQVGILSEDEASNFLLTYLPHLKVGNDIQKFAKYAYLDLQNTLMAFRKDDFCTIQMEPPFSEFGQQNFIKLINTWRNKGDAGYKEEFKQIFFAGWKQQKPKLKLITYEGGSGDTRENAIIIHAPNNEKGVFAEYWYLYFKFGRGW